MRESERNAEAERADDFAWRDVVDLETPGRTGVDKAPRVPGLA